MSDTVTDIKKKHKKKQEVEVEVEVEDKVELKNENVQEQQEEKTEKAEAEVEKKEEIDWKDKYYYLLAEMDNTRKRFQREKDNLIKFGNERILSSLVEVIDNFDHSISAMESEEDEKIKNILNGMQMVRTQFLDVLSKQGLERIDALGKDFDPNFHEAMAKQPAEDKRHNEIVMEYQKGYVLNGRLIRPSKVVVAEVEENNEKNNN